MKDIVKITYRDLRCTYNYNTQNLYISTGVGSAIPIHANNFDINAFPALYEDILDYFMLIDEIKILEKQNEVGGYDISPTVNRLNALLTKKREELEDNFYC